MRAWVAAFLLTGSAGAENPLSVELISETKAIAPGTTFTLGLHLKPPPGHHVYWKHPGIVGMPTRVEWTLPDGFSAGEIQWPAPESVKMARYTAQGYRSETLLLIPVTPPASLKPSPVTLTAKVSWMCCGDRCNPANDVPFPITLPVSDRPQSDPATKPLFEASRKKVPHRDSKWSSKVVHGEKSIVLTLTTSDPEVARNATNLGSLRFFTADGQVDSDGPQNVEIDAGGSIRMELTRSQGGSLSERISGVIVAQRPWSQDGSSLALEIP